jgi:hypothetical protein
MDFEALRDTLEREIRRWLPTLRPVQQSLARQQLIAIISLYDLLQRTIHSVAFNAAQQIMAQIPFGRCVIDIRVVTYPVTDAIQAFDVYMKY